MKDCPDHSEKGIYPNGGNCKFCGSVRHLSRDCHPDSTQVGTTELGIVTLEQGGDDDDVSLTLLRLERSKKLEKNSIITGKKVISF